MIEGVPKTRCIWQQFVVALVVILFVSAFAVDTYAQQSEPPPIEKLKSKNDRDEQATSFGEMVTKQQISRRRKEHEELLKRAEEAFELSEQLQGSVSENEGLDSRNVEKLQALERIVSRIRKDLGGDDDEDKVEDSSTKENSARQSIAAAFKFLRDSTRSLVDELKRTSRFSISALAIQTTNSVIRFARFLRLKKP